MLGRWLHYVVWQTQAAQGSLSQKPYVQILGSRRWCNGNLKQSKCNYKSKETNTLKKIITKTNDTKICCLCARALFWWFRKLRLKCSMVLMILSVWQTVNYQWIINMTRWAEVNRDSANQDFQQEVWLAWINWVKITQMKSIKA